jgi:CheY-like chemotaxis protein
MTPVQPFTIFHVDDDEDDLLIFREVLDFLEADVNYVPFKNGDAFRRRLGLCGNGVPAAPEYLPGLIILDINMPEYSGFDLLREIKADPVCRLIPVLIMSTSASPEDIRQAYQSQAASFIRKPSSFARWQDTIQQIIRYWYHLNLHT